MATLYMFFSLNLIQNQMRNAQEGEQDDSCPSIQGQSLARNDNGGKQHLSGRGGKCFWRKWPVDMQFKMNSIIINMLTEEVILQTADNRRCEKPKVPLASLLLRIDLPAYQSLIEWVFEISNELALLPNTKFFARSYFDLTLQAYQDLQVSQYLPTFLACLCLAIKFNELREVSDRLTPEVLLASAEVRMSSEEYFALERRILSAIRFRFKLTSPMDYMEGYLSRFPFLPKLRHILPTIIEFALIQPQACQFSAEEIFYGAVLSQFSTQRIVLSDFQKNVLMGLTDCWANAQAMSSIIAFGVNKYGSQQPTQ